MNDAQIQLFIQLIATHMGLQIRPQDRSALSQKLLARMKAVKIAIPEKYYQMLASPSRGKSKRMVRTRVAADNQRKLFHAGQRTVFAPGKSYFP
jgi:chemotaxis methyl-accepting protein methylase